LEPIILRGAFMKQRILFILLTTFLLNGCTKTNPPANNEVQNIPIPNKVHEMLSPKDTKATEESNEIKTYEKEQTKINYSLYKEVEDIFSSIISKTNQKEE